jgi:hypothetical protein
MHKYEELSTISRFPINTNIRRGKISNLCWLVGFIEHAESINLLHLLYWLLF